MTTPSGFKSKVKPSGTTTFKLLKFEECSFADQMQRNHHFSLIWITEGSGRVKTENSEHPFTADSIFTFSPLQPFLFIQDSLLKGFVIQFQTDSICIYQTGKETGIDQVLYDNKSRPPFAMIDQATKATFDLLIKKIETETDNSSLAQLDLMTSYLKILLIHVSRLKMKQQATPDPLKEGTKEHHILQQLKKAIDTNFRDKHTPSDYADMLFVSAKTLSKVSKSCYHKTLSHMINERIITEAKRELCLTKKAIKDIACELGYDDEYYFSRFFKINTQLSPKEYRKLSN
jgi:AraC family transcriptional regulator, transcriptional activator of pobA